MDLRGEPHPASLSWGVGLLWHQELLTVVLRVLLGGGLLTLLHVHSPLLVVEQALGGCVMVERHFAYRHRSERLKLVRITAVAFALAGVFLLLADETILLTQPVPDWLRVLTGIGGLGLAGQGLRWHLASRSGLPAIEGTAAELVVRIYPGQELAVPWSDLTAVDRTADGIRIRLASRKPIDVPKSLIEGDINDLYADVSVRLAE